VGIDNGMARIGAAGPAGEPAALLGRERGRNGPVTSQAGRQANKQDPDMREKRSGAFLVGSLVLTGA
jgi:hypothetical protein